jgi:3,4-dihydroxy-2-butanone 4-phosphate synthase
LLIKMVGLKPVAVITELLRALANKPKQEDVAKKGESDGPPFAR